MAEQRKRGEGDWSVSQAVAAALAETLSYFVFSTLLPRTNLTEHDRPEDNPKATSLWNNSPAAEHPVYPLRAALDPEGPTLTEREQSREDMMAADFLAQLEQRTQQVKITLANLEAEKIRIEQMVAQLQPIVPHYDALLAAERELSEAQIVLEASESAAVAGPPVEGSGWSTEPPGGDAAAESERESSGWSGSWNA